MNFTAWFCNLDVQTAHALEGELRRIFGGRLPRSRRVSKLHGEHALRDEPAHAHET